MNMIVQILQLVMTVIEMGTAFAFYYWLTGTKPDRKWKWVALGVAVVIISLLAFYNRQFGYLSNFLILFNTVLVWLSIVIIERKNYLLSMGVVFACFSCFGLFQIFFGNIILLFIGNAEYSEKIFFGPGNGWRIVGYTISIIAISFVIFLLKKNRNGLFLWENKWILFVFGIVAWWTMTWAQGQILFSELKGSSWTAGILLIFIWGFFLILMLVIRFLTVKLEAQMIEGKNQMWRKNYNEMQRVYEGTLYTYHDFKNHMVVLQKYADEEKLDQIKVYLQKVMKPMNELNQYIWSNNEIVNLIINTKIAEAQKKDISVQTQVESMDFNVEDYDFCCILSNLIDNAIEACEKMDKEHRWIHIHIVEKNSVLIIKISNSTQGYVKKIQNEYISDKPLGHGYGMKSVRSAIEKYGGIMSCCNDSIQFVVTITIQN